MSQRSRAEKDFWIEMSIREISTQCHFAELSYKNINLKAKADISLVFSSIHSFLSHCANVSKMLKANNNPDTILKKIINKIAIYFNSQRKPIIIGNILNNIPDSSIIHNRKFRNHLEHYDERLKKWIKKYGPNVNIGTYNICPKSMISAPNIIFINHYDPDKNIFTFVNKDFNLNELFEETKRIKKIADEWVKEIESGRIIPPFA